MADEIVFENNDSVFTYDGLDCPIIGARDQFPMGFTFEVNSDGKPEAILELCANGDIKVKGRLVENDKEVVDGFRNFLNKASIERSSESEKIFLEKSLDKAIQLLKRCNEIGFGERCTNSLPADIYYFLEEQK